jgi:hypothetical protein
MFSPTIHRYIFLIGVYLLAYGMMMGTATASIPEVMLFCNWLIGGRFLEKWMRLKSNRLFWVFSSLFLLHLLGMMWTQDFMSGVNDLRNKIPLALLPLVFFSEEPLGHKELRTVLYMFFFGCFTSVGWGLAYSYILHPDEPVREASRFMSHIRLGLYLDMAIACSIYLFLNEDRKKIKPFFILLALAFSIAMLAMALLSGIAIAIVVSLVYILRISRKKSTLVRFVLIGSPVLFVSAGFWYVGEIVHSQHHLKQSAVNAPLDASASNNLYIHFENKGRMENGYYVDINVQTAELKKEWKRKCPSDSFNYQGHNTGRYEVLIRYLASKGLTKDSSAVAHLSTEDIQNIQANITNCNFQSWSPIGKRIYELMNEYDEYKRHSYVNGHSLTMRLYFWDAAVHAISKNLSFGVGTGDVKEAMMNAYAEKQSPLSEDWRIRPHNQFLTMTIAFGVFGLIVFLFSLFYPLFFDKRRIPVLYGIFVSISFLSFITEDTLETQAGVTFYAFFATLLCGVAAAAAEGREAQ